MFDRGKKKIISNDVMTVALSDLQMCLLRGAEKRDVQKLVLVKRFPKVPPPKQLLRVHKFQGSTFSRVPKCCNSLELVVSKLVSSLGNQAALGIQAEDQVYDKLICRWEAVDLLSKR